jgi:D-alanyl-D-alanine carboxypeptidase
MDGIKTGYIRASGFNLAASAVRDGRRLVAVIMGGESAHSRDMQMATLLDAAFGRPAGEEIAEDPEATSHHETIINRAGRAFAALSPVAHAEAATPAENHREARERRRHPGLDRWSIQVGAFAQRSAAEHAASLAATRVPGGRHHAVEVIGSASPDKEHLYRARVANFSERQAEAACRSLHKRHQVCTLIAPEAARMASR